VFTTITGLGFSSVVLIFKYLQQFEIGPYEFSLFNFFYAGIVSIIVILINIIVNYKFILEIGVDELILPIFIGLSAILAVTTLNISVDYGIASVSYCLINTSVFFATLINYVFLGQDIKQLQLVGMVVTFCGSCTIFLKDVM